MDEFKRTELFKWEDRHIDSSRGHDGVKTVMVRRAIGSSVWLPQHRGTPKTVPSATDPTVDLEDSPREKPRCNFGSPRWFYRAPYHQFGWRLWQARRHRMAWRAVRRGSSQRSVDPASRSTNSTRSQTIPYDPQLEEGQVSRLDWKHPRTYTGQGGCRRGSASLPERRAMLSIHQASGPLVRRGTYRVYRRMDRWLRY